LFVKFVAWTFLATPLVSTALPSALAKTATKVPLAALAIQSKCIVWNSSEGIHNAANLLKPKSGQALLVEPASPLVMLAGAGLVIDFGVEITGSI
jgi:hypothetical protein